VPVARLCLPLAAQSLAFPTALAPSPGPGQ
jgi:hypothetical protein